MISNYARKESINMNSNTDCYPSGPPGLTRSMSVAPPTLTRTMSNAPPALSRSMSVAPSGDTDMQLDMGEDDDEEYDTMRDIYRMKQAGNAALLEVEEIRMFKNYIVRQKRLLLDQYAVVSDKLDELGERGWLIQNLHELLGEYTHRNRLVPTDFEAEQPLVDICPPGLTRSITISIPSAMDVDQLKGPVALTRSINTANDIFGFTEMASPFEPNRDIDMN